MTRYSPALAAHLAREATTVCHCWRVRLRDGTVRGFTDHDEPLAVDGTLFAPGTGFAASEARQSLGLAADAVDVEGALSAADISEEAIARGLLDDAQVETLLVNWREPAEFAVLRRAVVGRVTQSDGRFVAELKSAAHRLDQPQGRFVRRACDAELGDGRCGAALAEPAFTGTGQVVSTDGPAGFVAGGLEGFTDGWFTHGVLRWTNGPLDGREARVREHRAAGGAVRILLEDEGATIEADSAFTVRAGCDKSWGTCRAKFGNTLNFRGFPHLPGNDQAYSYVREGAVFDGAPVVP